MADRTDDTERLVARAQEGDASAFEELLKAEGGRAWAACLAILGNFHDAEDAMQEGALTAYRKIGTLRSRKAFGSWFLRTVANTAKNVRKRRRSTFSLDDVESALSYDPIDGRPDSIALSDAICALPETLQSVVALYFSGLKTDEIATVLDCPAGTVRRRLSTAYRSLREALDSHETHVE